MRVVGGVACLSILAAAGCIEIERIDERGYDLSHGTVEAEVRSELDRRLPADVPAQLTDLQINNSGTRACGVLRWEDRRPLILLSTGFKNRERVVSWGVVQDADDFTSENNQKLADVYLQMCQGDGLLEGHALPKLS